MQHNNRVQDRTKPSSTRKAAGNLHQRETSLDALNSFEKPNVTPFNKNEEISNPYDNKGRDNNSQLPVLSSEYLQS